MNFLTVDDVVKRIHPCAQDAGKKWLEIIFQPVPIYIEYVNWYEQDHKHMMSGLVCQVNYCTNAVVMFSTSAFATLEEGYLSQDTFQICAYTIGGHRTYGKLATHIEVG